MTTYEVYAKVCKGAPYAEKWEQITYEMEEFKARMWADYIRFITGSETMLVKAGHRCVYPNLTVISVPYRAGAKAYREYKKRKEQLYGKP